MSFKLTLVQIIAVLAFFTTSAQKISYSEPEREDNKRTNFEILGKIGSNYLIYKNNRNQHAMSVYSSDMRLISKTDLAPNERWINVDFVTYPDHAWMIYQFQQKSILYCMAIRIDSSGKFQTKPIELDTTRIGWAANNKIYNTIYSDDKKQIMVFKINSRNQKNFVFTTMLFDETLLRKVRNTS